MVSYTCLTGRQGTRLIIILPIKIRDKLCDKYYHARFIELGFNLF